MLSSSGAAWSEVTKQRMLALLPKVRLFDSLASSEGFGLATSEVVAGDPPDAARFVVNPGVRVLQDDGTLLGPGDTGTGALLAAGVLPLGYYKDPVKTASTFQIINGERYSMPGDHVTLLPDGSIEFLGRGSLVINTGGEKVYVEEVEEALRRHPGDSGRCCRRAAGRSIRCHRDGRRRAGARCGS